MTGILRELRKCYSALLLSGELERRARFGFGYKVEDGASDQIKPDYDRPLSLPVLDVEPSNIF